MVVVSRSQVPILVNESDSATSSGSGTSTSVSQNRPVVMPEIVRSIRQRRMGLVDIPYRGLRSYQRLERWTKSTVSCRTYVWGCLAPASKFSNGRAGKLCDAQRGTTREICIQGAGRTTL